MYVCWLLGWLAAWLLGCVFAWLLGLWLVVQWLVGWLVGWLTGWLSGWLTRKSDMLVDNVPFQVLPRAPFMPQIANIRWMMRKSDVEVAHDDGMLDDVTRCFGASSGSSPSSSCTAPSSICTSSSSELLCAFLVLGGAIELAGRLLINL